MMLRSAVVNNTPRRWLVASPNKNNIRSLPRHLSSSTTTESRLPGGPSSPPVGSGGGISNIDKVLIANRGEIACRVIRTCQKLDIPSIALYSNIDGPNSLHARMADESYQIGTGPDPTQSYLLQNDVIDIANHCSSQNNSNGESNSKIAIHPGYGFLR